MKKKIHCHWLIIVFCILAAIRVFVYSAVFPFFSNVDEQDHFDLVMKYSHGNVPGSFETIPPKTAEYIVLYESPEYFDTTGTHAGESFSQRRWKMPREDAQNYFDQGIAFWGQKINHESSQAPLYFTIAGIWMKLGSFFGIPGGWMLYWIRGLNIIVSVIIVLIAYLVASTVFPENRFIKLGVPLLAALLPQDTFYSIQNDVLSPLCFGLAFISMIWWIREDTLRPWQGILSGLAIAATVLVKVSNLPLLVVVALTLLFVVYRLWKTKRLTSAALPIGLFALCALVPVLIWFSWNLTMYGDLTASESKTHILGWTHKSFFDWFSHPIFTLQGALTFWSGLMVTFWRGEFTWSSISIAMPAADTFYWVSSSVFVALALINIRYLTNALQRRVNWFAFWSFASLVIFLGVLSISFDFGNSHYPSPTSPYFYSGRLASAALIPFLVLYVQGFNLTFFWIKSEKVRFGLLVLIGLLISISEIIINWSVFSSKYNFFHL